MKTLKRLSYALPLLALSQVGWSYPFDQAASDYSQIQRLEASRLGQEKKIPAGILPSGAFLGLDAIQSRLKEKADLQIPAVDRAFSQAVEKFLGKEAEDYGVAVLDLSDIDNPLYAEHQASKLFNPGSVGKLAVAIGLFQALADTYPDDAEAREKILRNTQIIADRFIIHDHHKVPIWNAKTQKRRWRALKIGDTTNLWGYLDWMLSASSNAAASMVLKQAMLIKHYGTQYPVSIEEEKHFFKKTPVKERMALLDTVLHESITRNGLKLKAFRQGGFFTRHGKARVPGTSSQASPREMVKFLLFLEQGKIVDAFSSQEIKRLLYITRKRIRYASHPALNKSAVYFKSGSYYKCVPEEGFKCGKYMGNKFNWMNSVITVESPGNLKKKRPPTHYMVTVMSNVKRKNSAVAHQTLAMRIHRLIESYHQDKLTELEKAP